MSKKLFLLCLGLLFLCHKGWTQEVVINELIIVGNNKTKAKVIERELDLLPGKTVVLRDIEERFTKNRLQLLGTGLFNEVKFNLINYDSFSSTADIEVILEENWYLFPVPIFELADRNFSVWLDQGASLSRTNIGFKLSHFNTTGNRDPLRVKIHFGYTRKYEVTYDYPYWLLDNKLGIGGSILFAENREIAFQTIGNKTQFHMEDDERRLLSRFRIGPQLKFRPTINQFHSLRLEYHHNQVDPLVAEQLNPDYFLDGRTDLRFFFLEYDFNYDKRLYSQYPQAGYLIFGNVKKEGLGIFGDYDNLSVELGFEVHHTLTKNIILSTRNKGKTNLNRSVVAFANNTGIGWNRDIVSGYELYVMDGTDYFITINDIKWKFFDRNMSTVKWVPKQFKKINLIAFLRLNFDAAIVNERTYVDTNFLNNRWFYGGGPALDLIFFNNFLFSFEYSFNDLGESGLFFHNTISF